MKIETRGMIARITAGLLAAGSLMLAAGCSTETNSTLAVRTPQATAQQAEKPGEGQAVFDSDDQAADALVAAVKAQDHEAVHHLLGPAWKELMSGDKVEDEAAFKEFVQRAGERTRLEKGAGGVTILYVGNDDWSFPIPIARASDGKWFLDTEAGKTEILARRIGKNELEAIQICRIYVEAQHEYAGKWRDESGVLKYAQRVLSTPGKKDGLYWSVGSGEAQSPLGRLISQAKLEGYQPVSGQHAPLYGYYFRILKRQGPAAPGGEYDYVKNGNMVDGFAMIAYPAEYGSSGIMTFIVNQGGEVYQKDLGEDSTAFARQIVEYNPEGSWSKVKD